MHTRTPKRPWHRFSCATFLLLAAAARASEDPVVQPASLSVAAGQPLELALRLPNGESWSSVNIGRFIIREPGLQRSIEPSTSADSNTTTVTFNQPGYALVVVDVGPSSQKDQRDSWRRTPYCTKLFVRITGEGDTSAAQNPGLTAKVGSRVELLPLTDPTQLAPGGDLPVRLYLDGDKQEGQSITAIGPDGQTLSAVTDSVGSTHFGLEKAGRWRVRATIVVDDVEYTAELQFDLAEPRPDQRPAPSPQQPSKEGRS